MMKLLDSRGEPRHSLVSIANDLLAEAFTFAQLAGARTLGNSSPQQDMLQRYDDRFRLIIRLLKLLEEEIGLEFSERIPYVLPDAAGSAHAPGSHTGHNGPKPHEVLAGLHSIASMANYNAEKCIRKAIAFVTARQGRDAAVSYVLDLIEHGYLIGDECVADSIVFAYKDASIRKWLFRTQLSYAELCSPKVVDRLSAFIEEAKDSPGPDEFLVGRVRMQRLAWGLIWVGLAKDRKNPPAAILPLISQLEEIKADSFAILDSVAESGTVESLLLTGSGLLSMANYNDPDECARVESSRAVLPLSLIDVLVRARGDDPRDWDKGDLPPGWREFSYRAINPVAVFCGCDLDRLPAKIHSTDFSAAPSEMDIADLDYVQTVLSADNPAKISLVADEYPWAGTLRIQLAHSLRESGRQEEALEQAKTGLHLEPAAQEGWCVLADVLDQLGASEEGEKARNISRALSDYGIRPATKGTSVGPVSAGQTTERTREAAVLLKWALADREHALGENHPDTEQTRDILARARKLRDQEKA